MRDEASPPRGVKNPLSSDVLMSIKPKFGVEILGGHKKYELRRLLGYLIKPGDSVLLYFTRPARVLAGEFTAGVVFVAEPRRLRAIVEELGDVGIYDEDWEYVEGAKMAMLIEARNPVKCANEVGVDEVKKYAFIPPSYSPLRRSAARKLKELCRGVNKGAGKDRGPSS